jgi:hypothetical protein
MNLRLNGLVDVDVCVDAGEQNDAPGYNVTRQILTSVPRKSQHREHWTI